MLTLFDTALSLNCYKVRLMLSLLGVEYRRVPVDLRRDEHRTPAFLALNPFGQVPVLARAGLAVRDSHAILVWLARTCGHDSWMPRDPDREVHVNAWLSAAAFELRLGPYDARLAGRFPSLCVNAQAAERNTDKALRLYEDRLRDRGWIALDHPTVADVAAYPALAHCGDGGVSLEGYGAIRAWLDRVRSLDGYVGIEGPG